MKTIYTMPLPSGGDDTNAFLVAFNSTNPGATIFIPAGTYKLKPDHKIFNFWARRWIGSSQLPNPDISKTQATIITPTEKGNALAKMGGSEGSIEHITFDARNKCDYAFHLIGHDHIVLGCEFRNANKAGLYMDGASSEVLFCKAKYNNIGIIARGANAGLLFCCRCVYNECEGIVIIGKWYDRNTHAGAVRILGGTVASNGKSNKDYAQILVNGAQGASVSYVYMEPYSEPLWGGGGKRKTIPCNMVRLINNTNSCTFEGLHMIGSDTKEAFDIQSAVNCTFIGNRASNANQVFKLSKKIINPYVHQYLGNVMGGDKPGMPWRIDFGGTMFDVENRGIYRDAPPPSGLGIWGKGSIVWNSKPKVNFPIGWVNIETNHNKPAQWKGFGLIV